ncbi:response regulator transcription factor [Chelatococcus sp. SYSU_G07232]|uniref:Response regulator transcription factor n=1 Tax=Chelatococcus albus TaxID=3047466 RepID=A0ABT7ACJ7_9HYPH|nr:response regulator transcription factor [Chelatococcus sp. SYSU_G07232]MDJ1157097.1 response regulator transcription factor [Chelatococcus sp. SYSU_G07232]
MTYLDNHRDVGPATAAFGQKGAVDVNENDTTEVVLDKCHSRQFTVVLIDQRILSRECLARSLEASASDMHVLSYSTVDEWQNSAIDKKSVDIVVLCVTRKRTVGSADPDVEALSRLSSSVPTILLSDVEDAEQILTALEKGARGYIPTSVTIDVAVEAMHLVRAGGTYVPASSLLSWRRSIKETLPSPDGACGGFTARQAAVLKALRQGKANKRIAYELNMRESTVKVHVRNIMKKLQARSRTEVAYKTNDIFADIDGS